jgi:hypothetical protein
MALSRLSSAPENASGYALPITQLTKSPPGPEAKVDIVLFISLSSLAANFVQASALPPPGNAKQPSHRRFKVFARSAATSPSITHNTMAMAPSIERSPNSRSVVETSSGSFVAPRGRSSCVRLQSMRQASFCKASPSTLRCASPVFLSAADLPAFARRAAAVYLLRSAQYQFSNCGVLYLCACRCSTCIELNLGSRRA